MKNIAAAKVEIPAPFEQRIEKLESEVQRLREEPVPLPALSESPIQQCAGCLNGYSKAVDTQFPTIALGGFFQADWGWFNQDAVNLTTVGDIQDGADFRRARLNAHGDIWDNVGYMVELYLLNCQQSRGFGGRERGGGSGG